MTAKFKVDFQSIYHLLLSQTLLTFSFLKLSKLFTLDLNDHSYLNLSAVYPGFPSKDPRFFFFFFPACSLNTNVLCGSSIGLFYSDWKHNLSTSINSPIYGGIHIFLPGPLSWALELRRKRPTQWEGMYRHKDVNTAKMLW